MKKPIALIILDGYGVGENYKGNAISLANTPNIDRFKEIYPYQELEASGLGVGLPEGQMGNSEVGHLNLGAGRIVYQSLTRVNMSLKNGEFKKNEEFLNAINHAKENNSKLHLLGLLSDGGVHSHINHFKALFELAKENDVEVYLHAFTDGRDTPPKSAIDFLTDFENFISKLGHGSVATISGRYYAMDRDKNWDRTHNAYKTLVNGDGIKYSTSKEAIESSYENNIFDEFILPTVIDSEGVIQDNDSVIFCNFRPDRAIQISTAITNIKETSINERQLDNIKYVCMMHYSESVNGELAFGLQNLNNTFGDVISSNGLKQLRIAETEKYAHVTFFFDGGVDKQLENSTRVLIPSPKVATYDLQPEMSAYKITDKMLEELDKDYDTIILNFANCDMVGHTGNVEATIKAVEVVDECVGRVVNKIIDKGGVALITADHGNADKLLDENGQMFTAHTLNPVPLIVTDKFIELTSGNLGDIAPTMLELLNINKPKEMIGNSLIK
ncbi:2,3-bisphosphoglycerate-independent phosphoglycerate mutase [Mycoplasmatota bacterium]|nr:2,3-bisphosphoglycerate-independent phosphoglycerate mutase [Mycoplasmatota bacterium]